MALTSEQIGNFRRDGFLAVRNFFDSKETQALQADIDRLKREGRLRNVATAGDGKTEATQQKNLQLCPAFPHSPLIRALPFEPRVIDAVKSLIGEPLLLQLDQIFLKPGGDGMGTNWHQDNSYFQINDPMKGTAMWIAIHDATVANGAMNFIPGVWREMMEHARDPMSNHHIRCYPDETKAVPCEVPAGSVLFFCYGTPHCTRGNSTQKDRAGLAYHFLNDPTRDPATGGFVNGKWPMLTGPDATGGEAEYGVKVAGTFSAEVEKAIGAVLV